MDQLTHGTSEKLFGKIPKLLHKTCLARMSLKDRRTDRITSYHVSFSRGSKTVAVGCTGRQGLIFYAELACPAKPGRHYVWYTASPRTQGETETHEREPPDEEVMTRKSN